eukprot:gene4356-7712_t
MFFQLLNKYENIPIKENNKNAYVTLITDESYVIGAQVLVKSLQLTNTKSRIVCVVNSDVKKESIEKLKQQKCEVIKVNDIESPYEGKTHHDRWSKTLTKLNVFNLDMFDKIVYIDSDCLVLKNIDELFNYPEFSAAIDCCDHFNAGVFVAKPSKIKFKDILKKLENKLPSYDKADQGFLNSYFKNKYQPLKFKYNADQYILSKNMKISEEPIKVIHYEHEHKPWKYNKRTVPKELRILHKKWWKIKKQL